ncbi:MAG: ornithine cyclodeaminase family protein [Pseudomonadota bacterium]
MVILNRREIEALIDMPSASDEIAEAFRAASRGDVNLPPVGHISFPPIQADCHIKYGHLEGDAQFVIKVATGFPLNSASGLPTGNGVSLVLSAETGAVEAVLHDEMVMTDIRTGIAGALATRALAREDAQQVLIVGTGVQALRQIESHRALIGEHLRFTVWGRSSAKCNAVVAQVPTPGTIAVSTDLAQSVREADIVVTATGAIEPLIDSDWVQPGTHITAVGADAPGKQELATALVARADLLVTDSLAQCLDHGEVSHAHREQRLDTRHTTELGTLLADGHNGRTRDDQITLADLTGIAAQDIAIAQHVLSAWHAKHPHAS